MLTAEGYDPIAYAKEPGKDVWNHQKIFKSTKACKSNIKFGEFLFPFYIATAKQGHRYNKKRNGNSLLFSKKTKILI